MTDDFSAEIQHSEESQKELVMNLLVDYNIQSIVVKP